MHGEQPDREATPGEPEQLWKFSDLFLFPMQHRKHEIAGITLSHLRPSHICSTGLSQTMYQLKVNLDKV